MPLIQPITRSPLSPLARGVGEGVGVWHPRTLFSGGAKGLALDLSDRNTLYQDAARTTLVSASGDPIGSPSDISGNGNHPTQATATSRPVWQGGYAGLDGVDDGWATQSIDFTGTDKMTVVASVRKLSDAASGCVCEFSAAYDANNGTFAMFTPQAANPNMQFNSKGTTAGSAIATGLPAPLTAVVTGQGDIVGDSSIIRVGGVQKASVATDQGAGKYGNYPLYIGRRGGTTLPLNGRIYRLIVIGRTLNAAELAAAERWCALPAGVTL